VKVSRSFEVLGGRTGIPKGLKQKWKIPEKRGVSDFGIWRARGDKHFGISECKGGLKYSCHPW